MTDISDLATEFERVPDMEGFYISSNAPASGKFIPFDKAKEIIEQLHARLETDGTGYDGIAARDATIEAQQKVIEQLREERGLLKDENSVLSRKFEMAAAKGYAHGRAVSHGEASRLNARINELEVWERFASYLIGCEGETITEEMLQTALCRMLAEEDEEKPETAQDHIAIADKLNGAEE